MDDSTTEVSEVASRVLNKFSKDLSTPELYLEPRKSLVTGCLNGVEVLFRILRQSAGHLPVGPLQELYTTNFDEDQVWEEVQLTNEPALLFLSRVVERLRPGVQLVAGELEEVEEEEQDEEAGEQVEEEMEQKEEEEVQEEDKDGDDVEESQKVEKCQQKRRIDDSFFSISAMEQYLESADRLSDPGSEGSVGMLAEELSDSGSEQLHYQDFFDPPPVAGTPLEGNQLSTYEREKEKMAQHIQMIEEANVHPKSWQMSGEASCQDRPLNSLLEEAVDFEPMSVPAPVVSEETTQTIEDIIRQRIIDQSWDDVQRKEKPPEKPYDYQRARLLNQEKSQRSLAEVYEEEYVAKTEESQPTEAEEAVDVNHAEIKKLKNILFMKLDALTNFHFTPKPPHSELSVISNVSAIVMEEALPSATAQHTLLAPEEVQAKPRLPERGVSERTATDKRRQRNAKKLMKRRRGVKQLLRRPQAKDKRFVKTSSRHFFASLQQRTTTNTSH